jgi:hypothetical protein
VSNPVAPPPPPANEGGYPPPANQGFGAAPAGQPGFPPPGQPQQGFGAAPAGQPQQGFGDAPAGFPAEPKKKSAVGKIILRIGLALVVGVIGVVVKYTVFGDKTKDAAIGDCIAASKDVKANEETDAKAKVVDCSSSEAAFTVVGRVNGETDINSKSCDKYFEENEQFFVYSSSDSTGGYLLCLKPKS